MGVIIGGMELLTEDEIAGRLTGVPGWTRDGSSITSTVTRSDFREAMLYTGAVAYLAETANHHPDIDMRFNRVRVAENLVELISSGVVARIRS